MSTREEILIALMDSYWFEHGVFSPKPIIDSTPTPQQQVEKPKLNRVASLMRKSHSDLFLSSKDCLSDSSPKSVLAPQLQTILSGKQTEDFNDFVETDVKADKEREMRSSIQGKMKKKKKRSSKSLSELEVEELRGFMDLGFVFSDQDKDSKLVSIIPGLQRLGKEEKEEKSEEPLMFVSRPYLSEAWDRYEEEEKRKRNLKKMDLRIPEFGNEMELKNHLRFWAHSVASAVR